MSSGNGSTGPTIAATATAVPAFRIGRDDVRTYLQSVFSLDAARLQSMLAVVDHAQVKQRYCIHPIEAIIEPRPLEQTSREYAEHAVRLGSAVTTDCLERARVQAEDVDLVITVSCTGVMIPTLDAHPANRLRFRP